MYVQARTQPQDASSDDDHEPVATTLPRRLGTMTSMSEDLATIMEETMEGVDAHVAPEVPNNEISVTKTTVNTATVKKTALKKPIVDKKTTITKTIGDTLATRVTDTDKLVASVTEDDAMNAALGRAPVAAGTGAQGRVAQSFGAPAAGRKTTKKVKKKAMSSSTYMLSQNLCR